ncbi:MAG: hypothetical protein A2234_03570 [Elusimicrobia bacterium RIFOXYA2_FULL_58_8]|nr:MAG: hypothetical protein A2285_04760 [Elusimicrobia bacterium RIFOXYA12_FULL_57_11]OGS12746.1 MAG: hypothetical protein A2234_03570 [Elusimicrobia bacterium RIFOXYA2_FULL_58_8]
MESKDLDRQMNDLWRKVSGGDYAPEAAVLPADMRQSNAETMRFLRENFSKAEAEWKTLLAAKDAQLRDLSSQLEETRLHLEEVKQRWQDARENALNQEMATALNLEESKKLLNAQKNNHARETGLLKELLERSKVELVTLQERVDALRRERDAWRSKFDGLSVEKAELADAKAGLGARLADSKEAVERTLVELMAERRARKADQARIKELEAQTAELAKTIENSKANWDAERTQWRELWDRERSVWETHRQEFAVWEERLRSEREAWTLKMREQEAKGVDNAAGLANVLKESSQWTEKVTQVLKLYALKGVELPKAFVSVSGPGSAAPAMAAGRGLTRVLALALGGLILLGGAAWQFHAYRTRVHYKLLSRSPIDLPSPSGFVVTKDGIWFSDWERGLALKASRDLSTLKVLASPAGIPLRAGALSAAAGGLWTLDMAQLRYIRQDFASGAILESVKTPGPAPQGAAWDGYSLWTFDAASGLLYKYSLDPGAGVAASYALEGLKSLICMQWAGGRLWVLDGTNKLSRYSFDEGGFKLLSTQEFTAPAPAAFWVDGATLRTVEKAGKLGGGFELRTYSLKIYN